MKIQVIAQGSTPLERSIKRWGLSILIDDDILFDTFGEIDLFVKQLEKLNVNINNLKHVIISHEHWDHTNGLWYILGQNKNINVYIGYHFSRSFEQKI
ncbi:MAG: MBL fold metallo-hydrolase, partial [Candidatus Omnitrophica bacterium]|nr:MBL fold metallo-hydrolase [Candidatus Omnitrophota bacterium]